MIDEKQIYELIVNGNGFELLTPRQVEKYRLELTAAYGLFSDELALIESTLADDCLALMKILKQGGKSSWKEVEMNYDHTSNGKRRIILKAKLKAIEKLIGALRDRLRRLDDESRFNAT